MPFCFTAFHGPSKDCFIASSGSSATTSSLLDFFVLLDSMSFSRSSCKARYLGHSTSQYDGGCGFLGWDDLPLDHRQHGILA